MAGKIIHDPWINSPSEVEMSAATAVDFDDAARSFVERLEDLRGRAGAARAIGAGAGTLENIRRGRRKGITAKLFASIRGAAIRELEKEIRSLQAELEHAHRCGLGSESDAIVTAEAALTQARQALKNATQPGGK